jgi:hypothetical protein
MAGLTGEKALAGAKELDAQLMALGADLAPKLLRASLGEALKPTLGLWRAAMREGTRMHKTYKGRLVAPGFSRRNSTVLTQVARDGSRASATVGAKDEAFYNLLFIETTGFRGGRGNRRQRTGAKVAPDPKLEPAFKATRSVMLSSFTAALKKRIDRAVARKGRGTP